MEINTDPKKIEELLNRSVDTIYPSKSDLEKRLSSGEQLRVYIGIDPTADYVHLGHSTNYLMLERFHELGHKVIVLVGDFTAMIGDPSDKTAARQRLTKDDVQVNLKTFKEQISKVLNFEDKKNPIEFRFNSEWLAKLTFEDSVELASNFTVQQMLERDAFKKRVNENKPLYVQEFFYPLMQGYDSVALDVDVEIGGTDQTFNMLAGRTLQKRYKDKEKFVISTTLLENPVTGEKMMSKSQGTGIGLNLSAQDMYGKTMALPDEGMIQCFVDCTRVPLSEITEIQHQLDSGVNPKDIKMKLARTIVEMYHSADDAIAAEANWQEAFEKGGIPENTRTVKVKLKVPLVDILIKEGMVSSKTEFKRLVDSGAIKFHGTIEEKKIVDPNSLASEDGALKIGKKRFLKIQVTKEKGE